MGIFELLVQVTNGDGLVEREREKDRDQQQMTTQWPIPTATATGMPIAPTQIVIPSRAKRRGTLISEGQKDNQNAGLKQGWDGKAFQVYGIAGWVDSSQN